MYQEKMKQGEDKMYESPFIVMTEEEKVRLGVDASSLMYDPLRHNGFQ